MGPSPCCSVRVASWRNGSIHDLLAMAFLIRYVRDGVSHTPPSSISSNANTTPCLLSEKTSKDFIIVSSHPQSPDVILHPNDEELN
ncbi:hypothetical protein BHE74_00000711 [Ensete ventricosum]|nr:hypothetical protein GW17_00005900 [Ensete ventricosum]RWW90152.1 hypothetical protein BHE74_00000711 [Ensete ventricosum]RZS05778.1 hypothetical protein BHM03_00036332 [Ensete ventricosum]